MACMKGKIFWRVKTAVCRNWFDIYKKTTARIFKNLRKFCKRSLQPCKPLKKGFRFPAKFQTGSSTRSRRRRNFSRTDWALGILERYPHFVLQDAGGKSHLVINLPRSVKVRHLNKKVRITGHTNSQGALLAESLEVYENNRYVEAWTLAQQMEENKKNLWSGSIK